MPSTKQNQPIEYRTSQYWSDPHCIYLYSKCQKGLFLFGFHSLFKLAINGLNIIEFLKWFLDINVVQKPDSTLSCFHVSVDRASCTIQILTVLTNCKSNLQVELLKGSTNGITKVGGLTEQIVQVTFYTDTIWIQSISENRTVRISNGHLDTICVWTFLTASLDHSKSGQKSLVF
jgi:hypothetical protein